jgi:mannose-6-phosphate isomerase
MADARVERIEQYLFGKLLPLWMQHGIDPAGGSHERLLPDLTPKATGFKRLMVQCRQLYVFSNAYLIQKKDQYADIARHIFEFLIANYQDAHNGGWFFSMAPDASAVVDDRKDAYGHAFVFFSMAFYYRAFADERALVLARRTLDTINARMTLAPAGFAEATRADWAPLPAIRRQNPHMHLLEGFILMHEVSGDVAFADAADRIMGMLHNIFFDPATGTLGEYFTDDWQVHPEAGQITEAGHHFEWYWLIQRYRKAQGLQGVDSIEERLYAWAWQHGIDTQYYGIYNEVSKAGEVITDSKRIWPVTECIKACSVRYELGGDPQDLARLEKMIDYLFATYLDEVDGRWHEFVERDGTPIGDELPGSTGYHIFLGLSEALRVLVAHQGGSPPQRSS